MFKLKLYLHYSQTFSKSQNHREVGPSVILETKVKVKWQQFSCCPEKWHREKGSLEKSPRENCPQKIKPRKYASKENCPPSRKIPLRKNDTEEDCPPEKLFYQTFVAVDIILQLFIFKYFIVTTFRGVSKFPLISTQDLLTRVVNGIN